MDKGTAFSRALSGNEAQSPETKSIPAGVRMHRELLARANARNSQKTNSLGEACLGQKEK